MRTNVMPSGALIADFVDKDGWGPGEWQDEPDKMQWVDGATGLACLASRGPGGHWCGYVAVPETHRWFGKGYADCLTGEGCPEEWHYTCTPRGAIRVHGGLTFAAAPFAANAEDWERAKTYRGTVERQAAKYPQGDSAKWLAKWGPVLADFEAWREVALRQHVCLRPGPGVPDKAWLFGFDCAHYGDAVPTYGYSMDGIYRDLAYVREECASLARQLALVEVPHE